MKDKRITSLNEYTDFIRERSSIIFRSVYRGQADSSWKLIPSFYRLNLEVYDNSIQEVIPNYTITEENMLNTFYQKGVSLLKHYEIKNNLDTMVVGQHHGLPTRLLDWTENPLYALYFAVEDSSIQKNGCVYEFIPTRLESYETIASDEHFKSDKEFYFVAPRHINERVNISPFIPYLKILM